MLISTLIARLYVRGFLSLHDEMKMFPLQRWGKPNLDRRLTVGSGVITDLRTARPPLKLSVAWLQGAQSQQVTSVAALDKMPLRIGDMLKAQGNGMCYVPNIQNTRGFVFTPLIAPVFIGIPPPLATT